MQNCGWLWAPACIVSCCLCLIPGAGETGLMCPEWAQESTTSHHRSAKRSDASNSIRPSNSMPQLLLLFDIRKKEDQVSVYKLEHCQIFSSSSTYDAATSFAVGQDSWCVNFTSEPQYPLTNTISWQQCSLSGVFEYFRLKILWASHRQWLLY